MIIKNIGHWWVKKDITILMPKNGIFAPKGDNLELFQWYMHFKSHLGPNRIDCFEWFGVPYDKVINKMSYEKKILNIFLKLLYPRASLNVIWSLLEKCLIGNQTAKCFLFLYQPSHIIPV